MIGRHVAAGAVEIGLADRERIEPEMRAMASIARSIAIIPCGPPKPRKAVFETVWVLSRRLDDLDRGEVIAIVGVEHRPVVDREAEVDGGAAARGQGDG